MAKASKPSKKIVFRPMGASVRSAKDGNGVFFDVTFKCAFSRKRADVSKTGIRLGHNDLLLLMQLAEAAHSKIFGLLANSPKAKLLGK